MEAFSRMFGRVVEHGRLEGFMVGGGSGGSVCISHLLFADDTLVLCGVDVSQFRSLKCLLLCFEAVSGLRINLTKSKVIPIGRVDNVQELAGILEYGLSLLPLRYLGLPLGASFKCIHIWDGIIERMERRLAGWKRMYLSKGGRLLSLNLLLRAFQFISLLYSLSRLQWLIGWKRFRGISFGAAMRMCINSTL
ncbi:hypothetical protein CJ030_MR4G021078 [Morella rubra]|uniref:Reverse transcriptase domain-containing protein n=1 Tax=Morella rubra TaxID=262757 RepID=A0A6A1VWX2_9ROSI|nr:hypothetical protein CJ030_MR4G021078 [Morella rubra]